MADCRLIYRSTCSESFLPNEDLKALVQQSAENNRRDGITGLLLLSGDQFLQVLEGPSPAVNRLFRRLCRDMEQPVTAPPSCPCAAAALPSSSAATARSRWAKR
jgi:hypothetical protein